MTRASDPPPGGRSRRSFFLDAAGGMLAATAASAAPAEAQPAGEASPFLLPQAFGAVGDGRSDDAPAIQRLVDAALAEGRPIFFPPGTYRLDRPILIRAARSSAEIASLAPAPRLFGAGAGRTVFQPRFAGGAAFDLDSAVDHRSLYRAAFGAAFEGFTIACSGGASGIRLRTAANVTLRGLHIVGPGGNGVEVLCQAGDNDASNMVLIEQVRIENMGGWGVDAAAGEGFNELSFLLLRHVFVQNCGSGPGTGASPAPASGGMRWKGQVCGLEQCAFTLNRNVGLYVPGGAGLAQTLELRTTAFENNLGRHLLCTGLTGLKGRSLQFYSNEASPVAVACELDGRHDTIRSVDIDGVVVRAAAGNRDQVAFRIGGTFAELDSCRVRNVTWENFDHPGQRRFDGFLFDDVRQCCTLRLLSPTQLGFGPDPARPQGNVTPLRLRGGGGGAPSSTGEWVAARILSDRVLGNDGLAPGRLYWIYLYDDNGRMRLEASPAAPVLDRASGYPVRPDDPAMLAVGSVRTGPGGTFDSVT
jgi:hypothetical protein